MPATRIIFGCGYLGLRVGKLWKAVGDPTWAFTRSDKRVTEIGMAGMLTAQGNVARPKSLEGLRQLGSWGPESLLFAVGYDPRGDWTIHEVYAGGLQNVLAALPASVSRVIYISTTGVYGSAGGEWVDELTPPDPQREGGRASLAAERILAAHPLGRRSVVLRMGGIYGPGRVPHVDKLGAGEPLPVPSEGWLNLVHVDDAARVVVAADAWLADQPLADGPHVFCVVDDEPARRRDYYAEAARLVGAPPPRFESPPAESAAAARAAANRRVSNRKMHHSFRITLTYPTFRDGLSAILGRGH